MTMSCQTARLKAITPLKEFQMTNFKNLNKMIFLKNLGLRSAATSSLDGHRMRADRSRDLSSL
jgi:hypothetical protein